MIRELGKLTALAVAKLTKVGMHSDGGGLYLRISAGGGKSWIYRYRQGSRLTDMGIGSFHTLSLADARGKALGCRKLRLNGDDPLATRKAERAKKKLEDARALTFRQCAEAYIEAHKAGWKNAKHAAQWESTLRIYVYPVFGDFPVQAVDVGLVMKVVEPIWPTKSETASRVRGRIEVVLDWATVRLYRQGENPARWKGHLESLLPAKSKVQRVEHHPALPYTEIGGFMATLRALDSASASALEFLILTAARTGEVLGVTWTELDLGKGLWTVPAERMKATKEHRVPLSRPAVALLKEMEKSSHKPADFVFPGGKKDKPLSNMALLMALRRMKRDDLTAHGFRSTFRDWAAERSSFPREVAEAALVHAVPDAVEAAYRRGDFFEKRRQLMEAWAGYCARAPSTGTGAKVVSISGDPVL